MTGSVSPSHAPLLGATADKRDCNESVQKGTGREHEFFMYHEGLEPASEDIDKG